MSYNVLLLRPYGAIDNNYLFPDSDPSTRSIRPEPGDGSNVGSYKLDCLEAHRRVNGKWTNLFELEDVYMVVTDSRVGFAVPKVHRGSTWIGGGFALAVMAGSALRAGSKNKKGLIAGHLRQEWIASVVTAERDLNLRVRTRPCVSLLVQDGADPIWVHAAFSRGADVSGVANEITRRILANRLQSTVRELDDAERRVVVDLLEKPQFDGVGKQHVNFPATMKVHIPDAGVLQRSS